MTESHPNRPRAIAAILLSAVLATVGCLLGNSSGTVLVRSSYDTLHELDAWVREAAPVSGVVIVYLDQQSHLAAGHDPAKPWPRELHARLLDRLTRAKPTAVVFDILFAGAGSDAGADLKLAEAIRRNGRVILAADRNADSTRQTSAAKDWQRMTTLTLPYEPLRNAAAGWGLADQPIDEDFTVRRQFAGIVGDQQPSLAWAAAKLAGISGTAGDRDMAAWNDGWVRYVGPPLALPHVSYRDALAPDAVPDKFFRDQIVFIGARPMTESFAARHDEFRSPFGLFASRYLFMPGVEVHATQMANLLRHDPLRRLDRPMENAVFVLAAVVFGAGLMWLRPIPAAFVALLGIAGVTGLALRGFAGGVWLPWLIVAVVQIPGALGGSVLFHSIEWYRTRRRLEAAKRVAEARIREQAALIDKAHDAILVQELDGRVRYANPSAMALFGWNSDEWQRAESVEALFAMDREAVEFARRKAMSEGEWNGELKLQSRDGKAVIVSSRWTLIRDEVGAPKELLLISTDITDQKQLEAQFLRTQRMETIGSLAGGMAHDLNNALSPILMGVQMLRRRGNDEESSRILGLMEASTHRGAQMVRQVLTFARGREGEMERLALAPLVRELEKMVRDTIPKDVVVEAFLPADLWAVRGNPTQLHQVLLNLCVNARDAMPTGGRITFVADNVTLEGDQLAHHPGASAGDFISLTVSDTGTGMPPEVRARIFEPFFTTKGEGLGTGIGLSTVLRIVKGHGGSLRVESEPGHGTSFEILLPRADETAVVAAGASAEAIPLGDGEIIVVADDERSIRDLVSDGLKAHGYTVLTVSDAGAAMQHVRNKSAGVRLLIADLAMPMLDGSSLVDLLRVDYPQLPMIVMTGETLADSALAAFAGVPVRVLKKPFALEELLRVVGSSLGKT